MSTYANGPAIIAMSSVLPALGIIFVAARFYVRRLYTQGYGLDDWLILPALVFAIGLGITLIIGAANQGVGYPNGAIDPTTLTPQIILLQQVEFASFLLNILGLGFAKLSILSFYRRIFYTGHNKGFDMFTKVLFGFITIWTVAFFFAWIFQCGSNVAVQWGDFEDQLEACMNPEIFNNFYVASDLFVDLILLFMPVPMILPLKVSIGRRLAILLVFALGALTAVASALRVVFMGYIYSGIDNNFLSQDEILNVSILLYWTMLETGLAVIVACLPILQICFRKASTDTVSRNIRGIFSMPSASQPRLYDDSLHKADPRSSSGGLHNADEHEMKAMKGEYLDDEERQL